MKKNYFIRIFITYILIILIGSIIIGLFSIQLFKQYFLSAAVVRMQSNLKIIESSIYEKSNTNSDINYNNLAQRYSEDTGISVTFLDTKGNVLGERNGNERKKFNLSTEFNMARNNNEIGNNYYYNDQYNVYILDIAKYIHAQPFNGYIHLSSPLPEINEANRGLIIYLLIGVVFVLSSSFILKIFFELDIISPLEKFINTSQNFNNNSKVRVDINSDDIIGVVAKEYNSLLDRVELLTQSLGNRNTQIEFGLNNVDIGLIIVNDESRIVFVNPFTVQIFQNDSQVDYNGKKIIELIKDSKINNAIKECNAGSQNQRFEVTVEGEMLKDLIVSFKHFEDNEVNGCLVIIHDITEIKKLERMSSDFVSNVSHELKTPLTSIKGFIETLKDGAIEDRNVSYKFLDIIDLECNRLYALINDILQFSQIQDLDHDINKEFNSISDILLEVTTFLSSQAKKKDIALSAQIQDKLPLILVNKNRIKQMFINVVDNAIKYTNDGGMVKIKVIRDDENLIITIEDDGIGIPKELIPRLFERFYRVDKGRSRSQGGTGLGLCIVKQIVEMYGGKIEVESEIGMGTEFKITLPIRYDV